MKVYTLLLVTAILLTVAKSQTFPCFYDHPNSLELVQGVCIPQCTGKDETDNIGLPSRRGLICVGEKGKQPLEIDLDEIRGMMTAANENIAALTVRTEELETENANLKGKYNQLKQENADLITRVNGNAAGLDAVTGTVEKLPALVRNCPAGLKDRTIPDSDMSASSSWNSARQNHGPGAARLDIGFEAYGNVGAWCAGGRIGQQTSEWIQVDFRSPTNLTGVITQGRDRGSSIQLRLNWESISQYVTSFKIKYSNDGEIWTTINKIFQGNSDWNNHVVNMFPATVRARYVRLYPLSCNQHCSVRMEYLTC